MIVLGKGMKSERAAFHIQSRGQFHKNVKQILVTSFVLRIRWADFSIFYP